MRARSLVPAVAGLLLLTGCTLGPSPDPGIVVSGGVPVPTQPTVVTSDLPLGPGGPGQEAVDLSWGACGSRFAEPGDDLRSECAVMQVPLNREDPGAEVYVSLLRLTAPDVPEDTPPVVVVLDEPGRFSTSEADLVVGQLSDELLAARPVVVMDRRGSGESDVIDCLFSDTEEQLRGLPAAPSDPSTAATIDAFARQFAFDCGDMADPHLSRFNSVSAADDLDSLRASLGLQTLDLIGRGDGATLGAVYAERYPGRTGALVLDGPQDPRVVVTDRAVASAAVYESLLDRFAAACTSTPDCALGADPRAAVVQLVATLDERPVGSPYRVSGGTVLDLLRRQLPDPTTWPALTEVLATAIDGDVDDLSEAAELATGDRLVLAAALIAGCNDTTVRLTGTDLTAAAQDAAAASPVFGPYLVGRLGLCGGWPAPAAVPGGVTAVGAAPILVVAGSDDPVAPATEVASLAGQMSSAVTITRRSSQHGSYPGSSCVRQAVDAFVLDGIVPVDGLLCPP